MGVVKEGTISGKLPSAKGFAVHYPGYPSSTPRAIETLGGTQGILKARSLHSNNLELHFRPEDPYSHPVFGVRLACNNFILKIYKRKDRSGQEADKDNRLLPCLSEDETYNNQKRSFESLNGDECQSKSTTCIDDGKSQLCGEGKQDLCADLITGVPEAYHFNGMVDYQHVIPVHWDVAQKRKRNWADMELQNEKDGLKDMGQENLMILVPPLFSIKDVPGKVVLKPSVILSKKKKQEGVLQPPWEMDREPCLAIDFYIENVPRKVDWEKGTPKGSEQWELQMVVCKLFDERPIWLKSSVAQRLLDQGLECGDLLLRRLLSRAGYYFSNGPFLKFWIRKGYDPRKDPESRIYQRIDFRVPPSLRSYCEANAATGLNQRWEDIRSFRVFPYKCWTSLQLFELPDEYIQNEIRKPPQRQTCSCATGWFSASMLERLRLCVAVRFLSVYPKTDAEALLRSASKRFEKSKRQHIFAMDSKVQEKHHQLNGGEETEQANEESSDKEDQEEFKIDDDEEEEEEIDDEDNDEEFEPYEEFRMTDAGSSFHLKPCSSVDDENISKTYLQELFGTFPSSGLQGADNSDGEYEIYEQDNEDDGNCSDDDYYY